MTPTLRLPFLLLLFIACAAGAQTPSDTLLTIVRGELQREIKGFSAFPQPPYYIDFRFNDSHRATIAAALGSIVEDRDVHQRPFVPEVRIGSYAFDNTHTPENGRSEGNYPRLRVATLPKDNLPEGILYEVWQDTQDAYRAALARLKSLKNNPNDSASKLSDFSKTEPVVYHDGPLPAFGTFFIKNEWKERIKNMTVPFLSVPEIMAGVASLDVGTERKYFISSEGTEIAQNRTYAYLSVRASIRAEDGDVLPLHLSWFAESPDKLPAADVLTREILTMIEKLKQLRNAPLAEPYAGPAILQARAAGVFFHEIFGHRIEGQRLRSNSDGQTFKSRVNQLVLPKTLNVIADPTLAAFNGQPLNGHYLFDDQGVKGEKVTVVKNGVLKSFLMSRSPLENFGKSNGHGRGDLYAEPVSRQSNLIIENEKSVTAQQLRKMLISECNKEKRPYGYRIADVVGGFTTTGRDMPNAFNIFPTEVYRVYVDGRPDELVRGVDLIGTPLAMFAGITAADASSEVFTGFCGAESGSIPVTAVAPSFFVKRIETQKKSVSTTDTPILRRPH